MIFLGIILLAAYFLVPTIVILYLHDKYDWDVDPSFIIYPMFLIQLALLAQIAYTYRIG